MRQQVEASFRQERELAKTVIKRQQRLCAAQNSTFLATIVSSNNTLQTTNGTRHKETITINISEVIAANRGGRRHEASNITDSTSPADSTTRTDTTSTSDATSTTDTTSSVSTTPLAYTVYTMEPYPGIVYGKTNSFGIQPRRFRKGRRGGRKGRKSRRRTTTTEGPGETTTSTTTTTTTISTDLSEDYDDGLANSVLEPQLGLPPRSG
ncbi:GL14193 [Drosophila persimilis]|uniref:GL14193 n=1 Tax=Drosophila persimilis TaxID=7234 RepID=B4GTX4_DROPE|nr:GL14193 [Drosophila persimilis]